MFEESYEVIYRKFIDGGFKDSAQLLWSNHISKIYLINQDGVDYIVKIKDRGISQFRVTTLNKLQGSGVNVPRILGEWQGVVLKERMRGISLKEYLRTLGLEGFTGAISPELKEFCKDFGIYLKRFHRALNVDESKLIESPLTRSEELAGIFDSIYPHINNIGISRYELDCIKELLDKEITRRFRGDRLGIIHGDFHNLNNIMVNVENSGVKFEGIIDFDSLHVGGITEDLGQIIGCIFNTNQEAKNLFLEGYTKDMNADLKEELMVDIYKAYIQEELERVASWLNYYRGKNPINMYNHCKYIIKDVLRLKNEIELC